MLTIINKSNFSDVYNDPIMKPQTEGELEILEKIKNNKKSKIDEIDHEKTTEMILEKFYTGT